MTNASSHEEEILAVLARLSLEELRGLGREKFSEEALGVLRQALRSGAQPLSEDKRRAAMKSLFFQDWLREENERKEAQAERRKRFDARRWSLLENPPMHGGHPYWASHALLLGRARRAPSATPGSAVTDFSRWVRRLYIARSEISALRSGRRVERFAVRSRPIREPRSWKLLHNGTGKKSVETLPISALSVRGKPMRGSPDFVFQNRETGRIVVVEIKASGTAIPARGWPDLRAQLWAYGKLDILADARDVSLVAEIWGMQTTPQLAAVLHWSRNDRTLEAENAELFEIYRAGAAGATTVPLPSRSA